jgi:hypothetical protein
VCHGITGGLATAGARHDQPAELPAFDPYSFEPGYRLAAFKLTKERSEI